MNKSSRSAKSDFQAELRKIAVELAERLMEIPDLDEAVAVVYDALREQTLRSWKNGLEAGRQRAAQRREKRRSDSKKA